MCAPVNLTFLLRKSDQHSSECYHSIAAPHLCCQNMHRRNGEILSLHAMETKCIRMKSRMVGWRRSVGGAECKALPRVRSCLPRRTLGMKIPIENCQEIGGEDIAFSACLEV